MERATGFRNDRKERAVLFTPREERSDGGPADSAQADTARPASPAGGGQRPAAQSSKPAGGGPADSAQADTARPASPAGGGQSPAAQSSKPAGGGLNSAAQGSTALPDSQPSDQERSGLRFVDLVVIGGGAAGMAAAVSARQSGVQDILLLERNSSLGGVLQQCIHNGFGLHRFGEDLTGVEFAAKYEEMVKELGIPCLLNTFVISLSEDRTITAVSPEKGLLEIRAKSIILAMGCRERSRNALLIPGARGAGILTAGTAQRYLNIEGYLPGKKIVIVGSGDIGLIMARQFVLEGCEVAAVVEIMPYSGGLPRNMKQCIEDFDIPVYYNSIIAEVRGKERVSSVLVGTVDENHRLIPGTEFEISCDTLLISAGLIPENELTEAAGISISAATKGAEVSENLETSLPGVFSCGNVLHVHDLVDFVSEEGEEAGRNAAAYLISETESCSARPDQDVILTVSGNGVGGIVPQYIRRGTHRKEITFLFRPKNRFRDARITASSGSDELCRKKAVALTPGEMCRVTIPTEKLAHAFEIRFDIQ